VAQSGFSKRFALILSGESGLASCPPFRRLRVQAEQASERVELKCRQCDGPAKASASYARKVAAGTAQPPLCQSCRAPMQFTITEAERVWVESLPVETRDEVLALVAALR
jgi:hypothetical protein